MSGKEIYYTICPVGNATFVAAETGILQTGLAHIGYKPVRLQTLPPEYWAAHFTYENDRLFRDGGNLPPLWAEANGAESVLIGLNLIEEKQAVLVRAEDPIFCIDDLRGKRIAIPVHGNACVDFHRSTAEQAFETVLAANHIHPDEVKWTELDSEQYFAYEGKQQVKKHIAATEIEALKEGIVDAIYIKRPVLQRLLDSGRFRLLYDIAGDPSRILPSNNEYPGVLTVSRRLAEEEPQVVVEFLRQVLAAAAWAGGHQKEAEALLAVQTGGTAEEFRGSYAEGFYKRLVPNFAEAGLLALERRIQFLYDHQYIGRKISIEEWMDSSFLETAKRETEKEKQYGR